MSGRGLVNLHRVTHEQQPCLAAIDLDDPDAPAAMTAAAFEHRCPGCVEALDMFVEAYGAEAGNLALRTVSTGGVFIGGGIAPKILPALATGAFINAFRAKPPLDAMLAAMPVKVILNGRRAAGAAVFAASNLSPSRRATTRDTKDTKVQTGCSTFSGQLRSLVSPVSFVVTPPMIYL